MQSDTELIKALAQDRGWRCDSPNRLDWFHTGHPNECPNYLDEKNPGPAHELLEVLRGAGWRIQIDLGQKYVRVYIRQRESDAGHTAYAPTFCRAVAECFCKCRGIWRE